MTYNALISLLGRRFDVADVRTREYVNDVFAVIRDRVLRGERVVIPRFGAFHPVKVKRGTRNMGKRGFIEVPASVHVRFRAAKAAKSRT